MQLVALVSQAEISICALEDVEAVPPPTAGEQLGPFSAGQRLWWGHQRESS